MRSRPPWDESCSIVCVLDNVGLNFLPELGIAEDYCIDHRERICVATRNHHVGSDSRKLECDGLMLQLPIVDFTFLFVLMSFQCVGDSRLPVSVVECASGQENRCDCQPK